MVTGAAWWRHLRRARRERTANEARLRGSEAKFFGLFRASPLPLLITTEDEGRIVEANAAAEALSSFAATTIVGNTVFKLGAYPNAEARSIHLASAQTVLSRELRLKTKGGQELLLLTHTSRITIDETRFLLTALTDVTQLRRLEERLLSAQRMEVIGQISGGVAHEFNNLLTVMQGHADTLASTPTPPPGELFRHVEAIRRAVAQATQITSGLLTFARRKPVEVEVTDLNAALRDLAPMVEGLVSKTVLLVLDLDPAPVTVEIGQAQIAQVLVNLTLNARDAMPNGGRLTITTRHADGNTAIDGATPPTNPIAWAVLTMIDTGCGMPDEVRRHIFEPFFTTKLPGQGTGLGLSICFGIVEQAGGHIEADSSPGQGTTIRLRLPLAADSSSAHDPATAAAPIRLTPPGQLVLLVEDEEDVREIVAEILEQAGYAVHACDGFPAVEAWLARGVVIPDLLLTDLVLPGGSGLDVARAVKARYPRVPVLFMSGYSESVYSGHQSVEHLLPKPFTSLTLLRKVREMIETGLG